MDGFDIPTFQASQDADRVYIDVLCQTLAAGGGSEPKIAVEGRIFGFHLDAYYLPLVLPGSVRDRGGEAVRAVQDGNAGKAWKVTLDKETPGEHFEGLETIQPQLLPEDQLKQALLDAEQRKGFFGQDAGQGVSAGNNADVDEAAKALLQQALKSQGLETMNDEDGEAAVDVPLEANSSSSATGEGFGFGWKNSFRGALRPAGCSDVRNPIEVLDPYSVAPEQRESIAVATEEEHWDEGIYMDNFLDIEGELAHVLQFQPNIPRSSNSTASSDGVEVDIEALALLLQLLFAYSYDERTNEGEATVESGWTIAKLSRSLAASTLPHSPSNAPLEIVVTATLIGCVRRTLTVPLYRHWQLAKTCIEDTIARLSAGEAYVRSCLLAIASRLQDGCDSIYDRLSEVWVAPLLAQLPDQAQLDALVLSVRQALDGVDKAAVGGEKWDLEVVEEAAKQAFDEGEGGFV